MVCNKLAPCLINPLTDEQHFTTKSNKFAVLVHFLYRIKNYQLAIVLHPKQNKVN